MAEPKMYAPIMKSERFPSNNLRAGGIKDNSTSFISALQNEKVGN